MNTLSAIKEIWAFIKFRKKWYLAPIIFFLILFSAFIIITEGSSIAPFIYAMF